MMCSFGSDSQGLLRVGQSSPGARQGAATVLKKDKVYDDGTQLKGLMQFIDGKRNTNKEK
jgi:hypothetical protein